MLFNITYDGFNFEPELSYIDLTERFVKVNDDFKESSREDSINHIKHKLFFVDAGLITNIIHKSIVDAKSLSGNLKGNSGFVSLAYKCGDYIVIKEIKVSKKSINAEWFVSSVKEYLTDRQNMRHEDENLDENEINALKLAKNFENNTVEFNSKLSKLQPTEIADFLLFNFEKYNNCMLFLGNILVKLDYNTLIHVIEDIYCFNENTQLVFDIDARHLDVIRYNSDLLTPNNIYFIRDNKELTCVDEFAHAIRVFKRKTLHLINS